MAMVGKRRGRPPNASDPKLRAADAAIGRTVWQLLAWGYPLRRRVAPVVATLAADILGRTDGADRPLSEARIEQLMEAWLPHAGFGWLVPGGAGGRSPGRPWTHQSQESLEALRPRGQTLEQLAEALLRNGGASTFMAPRYLGDPKLTAGRQAEWERVRDALHPREDDKTG